MFCSFHSCGMNHYSDILLQGGQVQILQHPRTVLRTIAEENILSGKDQIKIFVTLLKEFFEMTSQGNGEKEMTEIIWGYLEEKISLINSQNQLELLQLYKPNSSETHQCFCIFTTGLKNVLRGADCCQHKHCYLVQLYGSLYNTALQFLILPFCTAGTTFLKGHNSHVGSHKAAAKQHHQMLPPVLRRWILTPSSALPERV